MGRNLPGGYIRLITGYRPTQDDGIKLRLGMRASLDGVPAGSHVEPGLSYLCREMVADLALVGATASLMAPGGPQGLIAASDAGVGPLDALQFDSGEGPSRDAFDTRRAVLVVDLAGDERWPGFASQGARAGICAVFAFPLQVGAVRLGALTAYSRTARVLSAPELQACAAYAEAATEFLVDATFTQPPYPRPESFVQREVQVRTVVYQAQGMVMVDLGVSLGEALARLRAAAFAEEISLNTLAAEIVAGRRLPLDSPPSPDSTGGVDHA